jgi:hypothetical protein
MIKGNKVRMISASALIVTNGNGKIKVRGARRRRICKRRGGWGKQEIWLNRYQWLDMRRDRNRRDNPIVPTNINASKRRGRRNNMDRCWENRCREYRYLELGSLWRIIWDIFKECDINTDKVFT